ncbi:MAG: hybrid sensor histidine kinase/response regulator [Campylobacterota bacterium]|nr:hybrid sensor histidine kinase/response regulator [Campylobacterota bacterium]
MLKSLNELIEFSKELKLLYAEDDQSSREQTLDILNMFFDDIIVAVDGVDALDKYNNNDVDFVITDIDMPKINGLKFIEYVREKNKDIPVFILSAHSDTSFFLDSIDLGVDGYIIKPIKSEQFINQMRKKVYELYLQQQLKEYHLNLEKKVNEQVEELRAKDLILIQQTKLATMGEMMDIIAHQWKQPINVIAMHASLVKEFMDQDIDKQMIDNCYDKVDSQIKHMVKTMDDFRAFFRPSQKIEILNIKELLNSVLLLVHDELIRNNMFVELDVDSGLNIEANSGEIKHIFINLLNNTRDAFNENNIKAKNIKIEAYLNSNNKIQIDTIDNAGGIPEHIINNIFEANFTTKEKSGGTGMGLYMSNFIAKKNHAKLSVKNIQNGACFTLVCQTNC